MSKQCKEHGTKSPNRRASCAIEQIELGERFVFASCCGTLPLSHRHPKRSPAARMAQPPATLFRTKLSRMVLKLTERLSYRLARDRLPDSKAWSRTPLRGASLSVDR